MGSPFIAKLIYNHYLCSMVHVPSAVALQRNSNPIDTSDGGVAAQSNSTLTINPLNTPGGGQYQCIGTVANSEVTINNL